MTTSEAFLEVLRSRSRDLVMGVEFYASGVLPGADGYDPADALECFAASKFTFRGKEYKRMVTKFNDLKRSLSQSFNSVSLSFTDAIAGDPPVRYMSAFILNNQVEGLHVVVRLVSLSLVDDDDLEDTYTLFTGQCEKPLDVDYATVQISAKAHLGTIDLEIPPRTFSPDDPEGREVGDPLFEGFRFSPTNFSVGYQERVAWGGLLGALGFKKTVTKTLQYSSYSDLDSAQVVPLAIGRTQLPGRVIAGLDIGAYILALYAFAGHEISGYSSFKTNTPGFSQPLGIYYHYGELGGVGEQIPTSDTVTPPAIPYPGDGYYSRTAWIACYFTGTEVSQQDAAPEVSAVVLGAIVPLPDEDGNFTLRGFTDNPAYITRWILTNPHLMNLPEELIDDAVCIETARYCDQWIIDDADTDRVFLPDSEDGQAGVNYQRFNSTSRISSNWWKRKIDGLTEAYLEEAGYEFFDPTEAQEASTPDRTYRRRFTVNVPLTDKMKAIDFLYEVIFPAARMFLTEGSNSKIQIRVKKPADNTLIRSASLVGTDEIAVQSVMAWVNSLEGKILIDPGSVTSEVRRVTGWHYSDIGNSITLSASGGVTASGATFSGGNNTTTPATAALTVTSDTGTKSATIDGVVVEYTTSTGDTTSTLAASLAAAINANPTLNKYVGASWNTASPTVVTLSSKLGFLELSSPLEFAHDLSEEVLRVMFVFTAGADTQGDETRSNTIKRSFKWPLGSRQSSVNRIVLKYRESSQDYRLVELRENDSVHQLQVKKVLPKEINGTAIDNYHQARRIALGYLAELRDGDFFASISGDGEHLLIQEGQVGCVANPSGGFKNLPIRAEDITITADLKINLVGRLYSSSMYDDTVAAKVVPLPTTLSAWRDRPPDQITDLTLEQVDETATSATVRGTFVFAPYPAAQSQIARIQIKRDGQPTFVDSGLIIRPAADNTGAFEVAGLPPGTHEFKAIAEAFGLVGTASDVESIMTTVNGTIEVTQIIIGEYLDFADDTAREVSRNNLGAASADLIDGGFIL